MSSSALVNPSSQIILDVVVGATFAVQSPYVWISCPGTTTQANSYYNSGTNSIVAGAPPGVTAQPYYVQKSVIRQRMSTAGLQSAYDSALAALTADQLNLFNDTVVFLNTNGLVMGLVTSAGGTLSTILAPDPQASQRFGGT